MILEDFFTLSEMKDGLGTSARVKELISVMQEQKDCIASNPTDSVRQWSAVAKILAVTENKDCLEYFIQLDGLWFLNFWLQEAQKHGSDGCDDSVSQVIFDILGALDRLPVSKEVSASSGIVLTLEQVLCQSDIGVQEKGRKLLGKWQFPSEEVKHQGPEKHGSWHIVELKANASLAEEGLQVLNPLLSSSLSKELADGSGCDVASLGRDPDTLDSKIHLVTSKIAGSKDMEASLPNRQTQQSASNSGGTTVASGDMNSLASSNVSNPCQESLSIAEESSACLSTRIVSAGASNSPFDSEKILHSRPDFSDMKDSSDVLKDVQEDMCKAEPSLCKSNQKDDCIVTSYRGLSSIAWSHVPLSSEPCTLGSKESENSPTKASVSQMKGTVTEQLPTCLKMSKDQNASSGKLDVQSGTPFHDKFGERSCDAKNISSSHLKGNKGVDLRSCYGYSSMFSRKAEMELEFGDDALEVAVQVAIEAEREVADREQCISSQEGRSDGEVVDSGSFGLECNKNDRSNYCTSPSKIDHSDGKSSPSNNNSRISGNHAIGRNIHGQEPESLKSTSVTQQSVEETDKKKCTFDLNEGIECEDADNSTFPARQNLSAPIAVVAASKESPGLPIMPILFHGESQWRGSAATSAFHPASPIKMPDGQRISCHNEKTSLLQIDLNIADHENDVAADCLTVKPCHLSELPSHDYPPLVSSRRVDRINLDLNCPWDENTYMNSPHEGINHQKAHDGNGSGYLPASSHVENSSLRGIDLNDTPSLFDACDPQKLNKPCLRTSSASESCELSDPDVVILGSRMSTVRKEPFNHNWQSSSRGFHVDSSMGLRAPSMVYPYMSASGYGYNGATMGPNALSLYPRPYVPGSFPYMVDSRGATVVPQVLSSSTGLVGPPAPRPFFVGAASNALRLGMASNPPGLGSSGGSRPSLDLNSGTFSFEGGSKESGGFGKSHLHGQSGLTEEHMRYGSHSFNSFEVALKRKEPDPSWDSHTIGYKQMPPWH